MNVTGSEIYNNGYMGIVSSFEHFRSFWSFNSFRGKVNGPERYGKRFRI